MKYLKWIATFLFFIFYNLSFLGNSVIETPMQILASYSGTNAIFLHFSVYICMYLFINSENLKFLNSEYIIRTNRSTYITKFMKNSLINAVKFLLLFYLNMSLFIIFYFSMDYYFTSGIWLPCILLALIYIGVYTIFSIILLLMYLFFRKVGMCICITTVISIFISIFLKRYLVYFAVFELFYDQKSYIISFLQSFVALIFIFVIIANILYEVFKRKDLIYEEKL